MMEKSLNKKFALLSEGQQIELREELRPLIERKIMLWTRFLASIENNTDLGDVIKVYSELEGLEETEIIDLYRVIGRSGKDPFYDLERTLEDGNNRAGDLKGMLDEIVDICGLLEKPTKRIKVKS